VPAAFPADGLSLCSIEGDQFPNALVADGVGGASLLWEDRRDDPPGFSDIYVTRFTREGGLGSTTGVTVQGGLRLEMSAPHPNPSSGTSTVTLTLAAPART